MVSLLVHGSIIFKFIENLFGAEKNYLILITDDCMEIMQFVPFDQLLCEKLYSSIYDFNHSLLLQVLFKFTSDLW